MQDKHFFFAFLFTSVIILLISCKKPVGTKIRPWKAYDESAMLQSVKDHKISRMRYQLIQSKVTDKNDIWTVIEDDIANFSEERYKELTPFIYEKSIEEIQSSVAKELLTYEDLVKWFLYRIIDIENDSTTTLHTIIALNPDAVEEARALDHNRSNEDHLIYGMPILLKDNINTSGMKTTAGALALQNNHTSDAHIVEQLKSKGAIILGKANLSEWAYFFCGGCPVGYSAIGGQTLNPYGRGRFETGGSSSGSGTAVAANFAVAAIGTETSGSILSPSSKNSLVGLKPTVGLASRSGIVPISSTLDTPGPMTKNVRDNAILLSAMIGVDMSDPFTQKVKRSEDYLPGMTEMDLSHFRLGVMNNFMTDSIYALTIRKLEKLGATLIKYDPPQVALDGFLTLLEADMKRDLPKYIEEYAGKDVKIEDVQDVIDYNLTDTVIRAPYGQARLEGTAADTTSHEDLETLIKSLQEAGRSYFDHGIDTHQLDAVLSINNRSAGYAAVAHYPCLTAPMGYSSEGEPTNITFIAKSGEEDKLYQIAYVYEQLTKVRMPPF